MQPLHEEIYSFKAEWFDPHAQINRMFNIRYFANSNKVEIIDLKSNRLFLKKTDCPSSIEAKDFFLGGKVLLYSRNFTLIEYGDEKTRQKLSQRRQKSIAILREEALNSMGKIIDSFYRNGFILSALKLIQLTQESASILFEQNRGTEFYNNQVRFHSKNPILVIEVVAEDCVEKLKQLIGPLRARYGHAGFDSIGNSIDCAENALDVTRLSNILLEKKHSPTAQFNRCTCCVIQPHIVKGGKSGQVIDTIQQKGYTISAIEMFGLDRAAASEFLEVYDGVVPYYQDAVDELITGQCIAMEITSHGQQNDIVNNFREIVGPWDIDMAKELRPTTVRAQFGVDRVKNGVHCTDLPEDGVIESQFFFDILSRR